MKRSMKTLQVGDVFPTCQGGSVTVIAIVDNCNITVKHNDRYGYVHSVRLGNLNNGQVKNPYHPNVHGVGYMGLGSYLSRVACNVNLIIFCRQLSNIDTSQMLISITLLLRWPIRPNGKSKSAGMRHSKERYSATSIQNPQYFPFNFTIKDTT